MQILCRNRLSLVRPKSLLNNNRCTSVDLFRKNRPFSVFNQSQGRILINNILTPNNKPYYTSKNEIAKRFASYLSTSQKQSSGNHEENKSVRKNIVPGLGAVIAIVKWGTIILIVTIGALIIGIAANHKNDEYTFLRKSQIAYDSIVRFIRTAWVGLVVSLDYKIVWAMYPPGHPQFKEMTSKVHQRSADRILALCKKNAGVYIKGGQYIASMNNALPREVIKTLSVLQDRAPYVDWDEVVNVFMEDLGHPPDHFFKEIDKVPFASASLAQVHKAVTHDGREVAVKVQYPYIRDRFPGDMWSHDFCLKMISLLFRDYNLAWMSDEIRENLFKELDFVQEAANAAKSKEHLKPMKNVYVPETLPELTSTRILTMEFINGWKITDLDSMKKHKISIPEIARITIEIFARQIFCYGFVHCDPHPGNLLVRKMSNGRPQVVLLDHGLYREVSEHFRVNFCRVWKALLLRNEDDLRKYSYALNIKQYDMFAAMLAMRSYKNGNVGLSNQVTKAELRELMVSLQDRVPEMIEMMRDMPRELLLIMRNFNLVRSINKELGTPVNRFKITARVAAEGISMIKDDDTNHLSLYNKIKHKIISTKDTIMYDIYIHIYSLLYSSYDLYVIIATKLGLIEDVPTLEEMQDMIFEIDPTPS